MSVRAHLSWRQEPSAESVQCYSDNLTWIRAAFSNRLVVGSQARILYSNCEGRAALAVAFNNAVRAGTLRAPVVCSRDHHDVSGTDSPYRETSNVYDGSAFTADMAVQNVIGDAARGATWVALHNGGGVGWGEVVNGGFGLTLDGSDDAARRAESMLAWDVSNGLARRAWSGNGNARMTIESEMRRQQGLTVTVPVAADAALVEAYAGSIEGDHESLSPPAASDTAAPAALHAGESGAGGGGGGLGRGDALKLLLVNCHVATMAAGSTMPYGLIVDGAIGVASDGKIALVCERAQLPHGREESALEVRDLGGALVTPGLIDCHTHVVYGGAAARIREWEQKLGGASYEQIARSGGGIAATVAGTRTASAESLAAEAAPRVASLMRDGVTTIEIKSGYGLDMATERRQLEAAAALGRLHGCRVVRTFLGAHGVPSEYKGRAATYIREVVLPTMGALHNDGLIDAVDAFCETIALDVKQTEAIFDHAKSLGLPLRLHGDQLSDMGCAALAARHGALSCDHCEHTSIEGAKAMGQAGTVAVLLPASNLFMNDSQLPPVGAFRAHGVRMAVATNCNPGSSPCSSLLLALHLACSRFRLTPEEALAGATRHAAAAVGRSETLGTIEVGKLADMACWACASPAELLYNMGGPSPLVASFIAGEMVYAVAPTQPAAADVGGRGQNGSINRPSHPYPVQGALPPVSAGGAPPLVGSATADMRLGQLVQSIDPSAPCPPASATKSSIAIIGFPHDDGCVRNGGRAGAREGPRAFRERLARLGTSPDPTSRVDLAEHVEIVDLGDVVAPSLEHAHAALRRRVAEAIRAGHTPFVVGGGNDQSYPNARALLDVLLEEEGLGGEEHGGVAAGRSAGAASGGGGGATSGGGGGATSGGATPGIGVVNVDAHLDVRPLLDCGSRVHSGCPFRQLLEDPDFSRLDGGFVEFGAQPMQCALEHADYVAAKGGHIVWYNDEHSGDYGEHALSYPAALAETLARLGPNAFFSFDVDAIRAADMPAVSCPSPVGLSAADALAMCRRAGECAAVRLVDVSELSPTAVSKGEAYRSAKLVACMFYRFALGRALAHARTNSKGACA